MKSWFLLRVATAGLLGGVNLDQPYDFSQACTMCGAGSRPLPPVAADLARMGTKRIDQTAHDGLLIAQKSLAEELRSTLTGFEIRPVRGRSKRAPEDKFCWMEIAFDWPALHPDSAIETEDLCPRCGRAGHFDLAPTGTRLVYGSPPHAAPDFGVTWEYFGSWRLPGGRRPVGGARHVMVSSKARDALRELRLRHLQFEPLDFRGETLEERVRRVIKEDVAIVPYDPAWPESFAREKSHLLSCLPRELIRRIEHFGSTAIPGLAAKPVVDLLVEVTDLEETRRRIAPILEGQGYDYFWRPTDGDDGPPFYAWFIKRDPLTRVRTHHIHMVESSFTGHWDRLLFRDYLLAHPDAARDYAALKLELAARYPNDRVAYTRGKSEFIVAVTQKAKDEREPEH